MIRWSMLISHHPPCDYDKTWRIGQIRVCTRCLGIICAVLIVVGLADFKFSLANSWIFFLPLPAVADFLAHETGRRRSNNTQRFLTGFLIGMPLGCCVLAFAAGCLFYGFLIALWLICLEFVTALLLKKSGKFEGYLLKYEKAARCSDLSEKED